MKYARVPMSEMLRSIPVNNSGGSYTPQGQFVGNPWGQVAGGLQSVLAAYMQGKEADAEEAKQAQEDARLKEWMTNGPKDTLVQGQGPLLNPALEAPSQEAKMAHLLSGADIPEVRDVALNQYAESLATQKKQGLMSLGQGMLYDPNQSKVLSFPEVENAKREAREANMVLKSDLLDKTLASKERIAQMRAANSGRSYLPRVSASKAQQSAGPEPVKVKALPTKYNQTLSGMADNYASSQMILDNFKDEYSGGLKDVALNAINELPGYGGLVRSGLVPDTLRESENWWADYKRFQDIPKRRAEFGASLTQAEKAAWEQATVNRSMLGKDIRANLQKQQDILDKSFARYSKSLKAGNYNPDEIDAFDPRPKGLAINGAKSIEEASEETIELPDGRQAHKINGEWMVDE
jgi:hypothetical protein